MSAQQKIFAVGDILIMKKNHACGRNAKEFTVLRVGSDIRIVCNSCKHDITVPRIKLEKNIKSVVRKPSDGNTESNPNV